MLEATIVLLLGTLLVFIVMITVIVYRDKQLVDSMNQTSKRIYTRLEALAKELEEVRTVDKKAVVNETLTCIEDYKAMEKLINLRKLTGNNKGKLYKGNGAKIIE